MIHELWGCVKAQLIWQELDFFPLRDKWNFDSFSIVCAWVLFEFSHFQRERFAWIAWYLWNRRNNIVHGNVVYGEQWLLDNAAHVVAIFCLFCTPLTTPTKE